jgi:hypothetical protein
MGTDWPLMAIMQKFEFRGPRFPVDLPVQLTLQSATLEGCCTEISKEGMRLELGRPIPSDSCGSVSISWHGETLEFRVRVVHAESTHGGLEFIFSSDVERSALAHLVDSLAAPQNRPRPVLLKRT